MFQHFFIFFCDFHPFSHVGTRTEGNSFFTAMLHFFVNTLVIFAIFVVPLQPIFGLPIL